MALAGREAQIFALLSLAQGRAIHPNVLHGLHGVAKSLAQGDLVAATIRLAQIGLPPLRGPREAEMVKNGAYALAKGYSPWMILQGAEIAGPNLRLFKADWDEDLHPRDSTTGQFTSTGASASQNSGENAKKPDQHISWSTAVDAANHWLQTPVPEYDTDTGEQVATRPRWRALATNPIAVGAIGAAALLGGEALVGPAAEAANSATAIVPGFNAVESKTIAEAQNILNSPKLSEIFEAQQVSEPAMTTIGGRVIQYEPNLPASGMTLFGENGFLLGPEAFSSSAELQQTILHELYRLNTSTSAAGVTGNLVAQETRDAASFAAKALSALKWGGAK